MECQVCGLDKCEDEQQCALFWNLDLFNDFLPEEEEDPYDYMGRYSND